MTSPEQRGGRGGDADARPAWPGTSEPLGATWSEEATNFAVWAPRAEAVWVCLFDDTGQTGQTGLPGETGDTHESGTERRWLLTQQTGGTWHGAVPGVAPGTSYGFRAAGPWQPERGLRFNRHKLLLDPYGRAFTGEVVPGPALYDHVFPDPRDDAATQAEARRTLAPTDSAPSTMRSVVTHDGFDWGDDAPPRTPWRDTVVYELHTKGFTQLHDRIPEELRGTYAGLGHHVVTDYLRDLGVTTVELLPVQQYVSEPWLADKGLTNYWGYNTVGFFAPHAAYAASGTRGEQVREFQQMVKSMHAAGLEVVLDVVYNHTAEAGLDGPTLSFRGLDDLGYYKRVDGLATDTYWDVTGCGNTFAVSHPHALRLVMDSLRYWVTEMHVDGFRFDLLSALTRSGHAVDMASHLLTAIGQDPVLRGVKLIAEPWDASGDGYQVGNFPEPWTEWNDRYRDTIRDFWRAHGDGIREVASRLAGSSDLFSRGGRSPYASVNFVTAHDGFTLRDLVSYDTKHNEVNGEGGRDGTDNHRSWNCGVEGETDDEDVVALRRRQAANLMITLCLSTGVPMLVAGDERGRTQRGNNNAYSQDNEISWVDWRADDAWLDLYQTTRAALALRRDHQTLRQHHFFSGTPTASGSPKDLAWIHPEGREMREADWHDPELRAFGMFVSGDPLRDAGPRGEVLRDSSFMIWLNASPDAVKVRLYDENDWVEAGEVVVSTDTGLTVGARVNAGEVLDLEPRSVVVLRQL